MAMSINGPHRGLRGASGMPLKRAGGASQPATVNQRTLQSDNKRVNLAWVGFHIPALGCTFKTAFSTPPTLFLLSCIPSFNLTFIFQHLSPIPSLKPLPRCTGALRRIFQKELFWVIIQCLSLYHANTSIHVSLKMIYYTKYNSPFQASNFIHQH